MAQDHQKDTKPSEDNKVVSATGQAEGHGQARAARGWPRPSVYERFVGWLAIFVLWIAQAKLPNPLRWWREKGRLIWSIAGVALFAAVMIFAKYLQYAPVALP